MSTRLPTWKAVRETPRSKTEKTIGYQEGRGQNTAAPVTAGVGAPRTRPARHLRLVPIQTASEVPARPHPRRAGSLCPELWLLFATATGQTDLTKMHQ